jgi:multiple sugar transport system permease protein
VAKDLSLKMTTTAPESRERGVAHFFRPRHVARHRSSASRDMRRFALILTLPLTVVLLILLIYPMIYTIILAFTSDKGGVGLGNFISSVAASGFGQVVTNTLIFTCASTAISFLFGFSLAYAMEFVGFGRRFFSSILILPMALMPVVSGLTWSMMLNPALGVVNALLRVVGVHGPGWATRADTALATVILIDAWQWTPFCFLIIHAGFQSLAREPLEAALIDGATRWQTLRMVIIPLLRNILLVTLLFRMMDAFKAFDTIFVVTKGGPGRATETLVIRAFMQAFQFYEPRTTAAIGVLLLIATMLATRRIGDLIGQEVE